MAAPRASGRMIRRDVAGSEKLAKLSPQALSLFLLLIPFFDSHGKMNGSPLYIKAEVCPLIPWLTPRAIEKALREIDAATNVKWFQSGGRWWLHSLSWAEHQELRADRLGADTLPSYPSAIVPEKSRSGPGDLRREVEVEGKEKGKGKLKEKAAPAGAAESPRAAAGGNGSTPRLGSESFREVVKEHCATCPKPPAECSSCVFVDSKAAEERRGTEAVG